MKLAKALGIAAACGTIEAGKRADLILVRIDAAHMQPVNDIFSQLVHCANARSPGSMRGKSSPTRKPLIAISCSG